MTYEFKKIYRLTGSGAATPAETFAGCITPVREPKSRSELQLSLAKARSGEYDGVLFAHGALEVQPEDSVARLIRRFGMRPIVSLPLDLLRDGPDRLHRLLARSRQLECHTIFLIRESRDLSSEARTVLRNMIDPHHVLALVTKKLDLDRLLEWIPESSYSNLRLYFPHASDDHPEILSTQEVFDSLENSKKRASGFIPKALSGLEIYDPRIPSDLDLEPLVDPIFESGRMTNSDVSIVIPAFDNAPHLLQTLHHLQEQDCPRGAFEVIVVDDGSSDDTYDRTLEFARQTKMPFSFLHVPRERARVMGDNRFRAGVARNLGVKHARGSILQFLDCDILVAPNFVKKLIQDHAHSDVIQAKRIQLSREATLRTPRYTEILEGRDTYVREGAYWETFQDTTTDWNGLQANWKYVSSFCLSVKTEHFKNVGWFKKVHAWYGFEDTDLGMRLINEGRRLHLSSSRVYHLYHQDTRSEWGNSADAKKALLSRTCKIFYHHHLDPRIFEELRVFMA